MKRYLYATLFVLALSLTCRANDQWQKGDNYKLVSLAQLFECKIKINYVTDYSLRFKKIKIETGDSCRLMDLITNTTLDAEYQDKNEEFKTKEYIITLRWHSPGFGPEIVSGIKATVYTDAKSNRCLLAESEVINRGYYLCGLWDVMPCYIQNSGLVNNI